MIAAVAARRVAVFARDGSRSGVGEALGRRSGGDVWASVWPTSGGEAQDCVWSCVERQRTMSAVAWRLGGAARWASR